MVTKIPVLMTDEDAALFVLFMKHYDKIGFLMNQGVFDLKNGSANLHFDKAGNLQSIEKRTVAYVNAIDLRDL